MSKNVPNWKIKVKIKSRLHASIFFEKKKVSENLITVFLTQVLMFNWHFLHTIWFEDNLHKMSKPVVWKKKKKKSKSLLKLLHSINQKNVLKFFSLLTENLQYSFELFSTVTHHSCLSGYIHSIISCWDRKKCLLYLDIICLLFTRAVKVFFLYIVCFYIVVTWV